MWGHMDDICNPRRTQLRSRAGHRVNGHCPPATQTMEEWALTKLPAPPLAQQGHQAAARAAACSLGGIERSHELEVGWLCC